MKLYVFKWPSRVGGADTKLVHLLELLAPHYDLTVLPNGPERLQEAHWTQWMTERGIRYSLLEDLPDRLEGWCLSLCNPDFFRKHLAGQTRRRGLRLIWSSEMMWHHEGELGHVLLGWIDKILYVSPGQRAALEPGYLSALRYRAPEECPVEGELEAERGLLTGPGGSIPWVMTGNYINPADFPFRDRAATRKPGDEVVIGRLSRPDPAKFPENFPDSYERLGVENARFRVMAWNPDFSVRWPDKTFNQRWDLLPAGAEPSASFLQSLDLFVYDVSPCLSESWGRALVEAMLTGAVPIVTGHGRHHLRHLVPHGAGGFLCHKQEEFGQYARLLANDSALRDHHSRLARAWAAERLCNREEHLRIWRSVFED